MGIVFSMGGGMDEIRWGYAFITLTSIVPQPVGVGDVYLPWRVTSPRRANRALWRRSVIWGPGAGGGDRRTVGGLIPPIPSSRRMMGRRKRLLLDHILLCREYRGVYIRYISVMAYYCCRAAGSPV